MPSRSFLYTSPRKCHSCHRKADIMFCRLPLPINNRVDEILRSDEKPGEIYMIPISQSCSKNMSLDLAYQTAGESFIRYGELSSDVLSENMRIH